MSESTPENTGQAKLNEAYDAIRLQVNCERGKCTYKPFLLPFPIVKVLRMSGDIDTNWEVIARSDRDEYLVVLFKNNKMSLRKCIPAQELEKLNPDLLGRKRVEPHLATREMYEEVIATGEVSQNQEKLKKALEPGGAFDQFMLTVSDQLETELMSAISEELKGSVSDDIPEPTAEEMAQLASDEVNDLLKAIMDKEIAGNNFIQTIIPQMSRDDFSARVKNMLRATLLQCWKEGRKGKILMN